jgi:hypothetical protein
MLVSISPIRLLFYDYHLQQSLRHSDWNFGSGFGVGCLGCFSRRNLGDFSIMSCMNWSKGCFAADNSC